MSVDDNLTNTRRRPTPGVLDLIEVQPSRAEPVRDVENESEVIHLPDEGETYRAHGRPDRKPQLMLRLVLGPNLIRGFSYGNLEHLDMIDRGDPGSGSAIILRFAGMDPTEVRIEGRNLQELHDYLAFQRIAYIRCLAEERDFLPASCPVVHRISILPWGS